MTPPTHPDTVTTARAALEKVRSAIARNAETVARLQDDLAAMQRAQLDAATDAAFEGFPAPKTPASHAIKLAELDLAQSVATDLASREQIAVSSLQNAACDWLSNEVRAEYARRAEAGKAALDKLTEILAELLRAQGVGALEIIQRMLREIPSRDYVGETSLAWIPKAAAELGVHNPLSGSASNLETSSGFLTLADAMRAAEKIGKSAVS